MPAQATPVPIGYSPDFRGNQIQNSTLPDFNTTAEADAAGQIHIRIGVQEWRRINGSWVLWNGSGGTQINTSTIATAGTVPQWTGTGPYTLNIPLASTAGVTAGLLSKASFDLFSGKQNALTFDSSPTSGSSNPVTSGGIFQALTTKQDTLSVSSQRLIGRGTAGVGPVEQITIGTGLTLSGGVLSASGSGGGTSGTVIDTATVGTAGTAPAWTGSGPYQLQIPNASTSSVTGGLISRAQYDVFNAKQNAISLPTQTLMGRSSSGTGAYEAITLGAGLTLSSGVLSSSGTGGSATLTGLTDVADTFTGLTTGHILQYNGTTWTNAPTTLMTISGDATLSSTGVLTIANTSVTPGTYGGASFIPQFTVDSKGRITGVTNIAVTTGGGLNNPLPAGSAASPAIQFGTTNKGIYAAGTNQLGFAVEGAQVMTIDGTRMALRRTTNASGVYFSSTSYSANATDAAARFGLNNYINAALQNTKDNPALGGASMYFGSSSTQSSNYAGLVLFTTDATPTSRDVFFSALSADGSKAITNWYGDQIFNNGLGIGITPATSKLLHVYGAGNISARFESGASVGFDLVKGTASQFGGVDFFTGAVRQHFISHWSDNTLRIQRDGAASAAIQVETDGTVSFQMGISGTLQLSNPVAGPANFLHQNLITTGNAYVQYVQQANGSEGGIFTNSTQYTTTGQPARTCVFSSNNTASTGGIDFANLGTGPQSFRWIFESAATGVTMEYFRNGHLFMRNAISATLGTPANGGYLYVEQGNLKWKSSAGTVSNITPGTSINYADAPAYSDDAAAAAGGLTRGQVYRKTNLIDGDLLAVKR